MDSSTPSPLLPNETFLVYRFALVATESERPTQKIVKVGEFNSAEDALDLARDHAIALVATHTSAVVSGAKDGAAAVLAALRSQIAPRAAVRSG